MSFHQPFVTHCLACLETVSLHRNVKYEGWLTVLEPSVHKTLLQFSEVLIFVDIGEKDDVLHSLTLLNNSLN